MLAIFALILILTILNILGVAGIIVVVMIVLVFVYAITQARSRQSYIETSQQDLGELLEQTESEPQEVIIHEEPVQVWTLDRLYALTPPQFEVVVAMMLERSNYTQVEVVGGSGDLCADIKAISEKGELVVVQCKRYGSKKRVSSGEMQQFLGMITIHHRADKGIYVTTSSYTKQARELGEDKGIELIDSECLVEIFCHSRYKDIQLP